MIHISLLTLLATTAFAGPLPKSGKSSYISACDAADNCETYTDPTSGYVNVRFKAGMEPGTDDYNTRVAGSHAKRQSGYPQTQVTIGDDTIYWGCDIDPVATLDHVGDVCATSGQCISNSPWTESVDYLGPDVTEKTPEPLTISAVGTYPSWIRNGLVQAVQAVMSADGVVNTTAMTYITQDGPISSQGITIVDHTCNVAQAPSFIGLGVYSAENVLEATISVTVSVQVPESGFCAMASQAALAGSVAGAFDAEGVGAPVSAVFGTISAVCAIVDPSGS